MKTQYVDMSKKTQQYLLSFLSLFPKKEMYPLMDIIKLTYKESRAEYPEIILNLTWALTGAFKVISLVNEVGPTSAIEHYDHLLELIHDKSKSEACTKQLLLYYGDLHNNKHKLVASAPNFTKAVKSLYTQLTLQTKIEIAGYIRVIPNLIILREGDGQFTKMCFFQFNRKKKVFEQLF